MSQDDILRCVELLDLDETAIDKRLKVIMSRETHTEKQLLNSALLLSYKLLINQQDNDDCDNNEELEFAVKLLTQVNEQNVSSIGKIINLVLNLNKATLGGKAEHLLQQILSDVFNSLVEEHDATKEILNLKICDSILDALLSNGIKASLMFLEPPIDKILLNGVENLRTHFLIYTVPKLVNGTVGYDVLEKILAVIKEYKDERTHEGLKILCCLADYYLPIPGDRTLEQSSPLNNMFWRMVHYGMNSFDPYQRKVALYLAKRGVESNVTNHGKSKEYWDNYFVLIETLEEKQSNIVLPSLKLFETLLPHVSKQWLEIPYKIGLKHENTQVKRRCIELRLNHAIENNEEAKNILESINDGNLFSNTKEIEKIVSQLKLAIENCEHYFKVLTTIPTIQWSPVPIYYVTSALLPAPFNEDFVQKNEEAINQAVLEIMKLQCNNVAIKKHIQIVMIKFVCKLSKYFHWETALKLLASSQLESWIFRKFTPDLNTLKVNEDEKIDFHNFITSSTIYIKEALKYFTQNNDIDTFLEIINEKIRRIKDINSRQYSNRMESFNDCIYLSLLHDESWLKSDEAESKVNSFISSEIKVLVAYLMNVLSDDVDMVVEDQNHLEVAARFIILCDEMGLKELVEEAYKAAKSIATDKSNNDLARKVFSLRILDYLPHDVKGMNLENDLEAMLKLRLPTKNNDNKENMNKLKDDFCEVTGKIVFSLLEKTDVKEASIDLLIDYIEYYMECGNGDCVYRVVKAAAYTLDRLKPKSDLKKFITRSWREIEEIKGSKTYNECMEVFTSILLNDAVLADSEYNNIVEYYFNKIMELARSNAVVEPLFNFVCGLNDKNITSESTQLVHFLEEILFFAPVVKKELRITESIAHEIYKRYNLDTADISTYTVQSVQELLLTTLLKITDLKVHHQILYFIIRRINDTFKTRDRYHADSQPHKTLLIGLQHMLFYALIETKLMTDDRKIVGWSVMLLGIMPHQPSVRVCLEWYIALYIIAKNLPLNKETVNELDLNTVSQTSQLFILFHAMNHRIRCELYKNDEYDFVMRTLLSHSMGPAFNVRLHAQYLALLTYKNAKPNPDIHKYTMDIVEKTLQDMRKKINEKSLRKLENDVFATKFDVVFNLTPYFIFRFLPKYFKMAGLIEGGNVLPKIDDCKRYMELMNCDVLKSWSLYCMADYEVDEIKIVDDLAYDGVMMEEVDGAIQKKYIPWKDMSEIGCGDNLVKKETTSDLIIVASLINKLPNLGGLARTSEVFGVRNYVVPSLAKLKDPQFQGLSVSAERWVDIQEVRPDRSLKYYLMMKKDEGYTIVAAEQTSDSVPLQGFRFPKKTVLVLGHEKNGIPCDLLPLMDNCVEVPQSGFVRSLNVHVTAAIFVWEYNKQNML